MTLDANSPDATSSKPTISPALEFLDYNISQITPHLYVTAADTAQQFDKIFSNGIGCVINCAEELPQLLFPPETGVESLKIPVQDFPSFPASNYFDMVSDRIDANVRADRRTLLYCHFGRSRSVTFILAYLIKHQRMPLSTAYAMVKEKRLLALPNFGFWSQLESYEQLQRQTNPHMYAKHENHHYVHHHPYPHHYQQQQQYRPHFHHREYASSPRRNPLHAVENKQSGPPFHQQLFTEISDGLAAFFKDNPLVHLFSHGIKEPHPKVPRHHTMSRRHPVIPYQKLFSAQFH